MKVRWVHLAHPHLFPRWRYACLVRRGNYIADNPQGVNGLTARDIKLIMDGGYNTVEAIAYTYVPIVCNLARLLMHSQTETTARANKRHF